MSDVNYEIPTFPSTEIDFNPGKDIEGVSFVNFLNLYCLSFEKSMKEQKPMQSANQIFEQLFKNGNNSNTKRGFNEVEEEEISARGNSKRLVNICAHCGVTSTPLWRRVGKERVCNACGLYFKSYGRKKNDNSGIRIPRNNRCFEDYHAFGQHSPSNLSTSSSTSSASFKMNSNHPYNNNYHLEDIPQSSFPTPRAEPIEVGSGNTSNIQLTIRKLKAPCISDYIERSCSSVALNKSDKIMENTTFDYPPRRKLGSALGLQGLNQTLLSNANTESPEDTMGNSGSFNNNVNSSENLLLDYIKFDEEEEEIIDVINNVDYSTILF